MNLNFLLISTLLLSGCANKTLAPPPPPPQVPLQISRTLDQELVSLHNLYSANAMKALSSMIEGYRRSADAERTLRQLVERDNEMLVPLLVTSLYMGDQEIFDWLYEMTIAEISLPRIKGLMPLFTSFRQHMPESKRFMICYINNERNADVCLSTFDSLPINEKNKIIRRLLQTQ